jgi:hypothetical protein
MTNKILIIFTLLLFFALSASASANTNLKSPKLFLFFGPGKVSGAYNEKLNLKKYQHILSNPVIKGAQVLYTWKELEPTKGNYNPKFGS